jgi:vitamin K-dependent gamma-carboxylase-like protein
MRQLENIAKLWNGLVRHGQTPRQLIGPSLFRWIAGLNILGQYLTVYSQRAYLFGNSGMVSYEQYLKLSGRFSLYQWASTDVAFELVYHGGILLTAAWAAGYFTRWLTPLVWLFWQSFVDRGQAMWDGGDNLAGILLIYFCFADLGAHFSAAPGPQPRPVSRIPALGILHDVALRAAGLQVCIVYFVAGVLKARGHSWLDGSALYASWADEEFRWPGVTDVLSGSDALVSLMGPLTILFQLSFPFFFLLGRRSRTIILIVAMGFHLSIGLLMGLLSFAAFFIAAELALISDAEYAAFISFVRRLFGQTRAWRLAAPP